MQLIAWAISTTGVSTHRQSDFNDQTKPSVSTRNPRHSYIRSSSLSYVYRELSKNSTHFTSLPFAAHLDGFHTEGVGHCALLETIFCLALAL
jgi:hypothetical protein